MGITELKILTPNLGKASRTISDSNDLFDLIAMP